MFIEKKSDEVTELQITLKFVSQNKKRKELAKGMVMEQRVR